jgi:hypothetical protein
VRSNLATGTRYQRKVVSSTPLNDAFTRGRDRRRSRPRSRSTARRPPAATHREHGAGARELRENRLMYETYTAILGAQFELMRASIESGR